MAPGSTTSASADEAMAMAQTALLALHKAMREFYAAFAKGQPAPGLGPDTAAEYKAVQATVGLPGLIDIERRTIGS